VDFHYSTGFVVIQRPAGHDKGNDAEAKVGQDACLLSSLCSFFHPARPIFVIRQEASANALRESEFTHNAH
jgi:hypothetical protein